MMNDEPGQFNYHTHTRGPVLALRLPGSSSAAGAALLKGQIMKRELIIADAHSENGPKTTCKIELSGGAPWYGYAWIDDVCYEIIDGPRTVRFKKFKACMKGRKHEDD